MGSVILTFNTTDLPVNVNLCYQVFAVKQYVPSVSRCFKCQRFGHTADSCRSKLRCVRCGEQHTFEQCKKKLTPVCANCGGEHSAAFHGCEQAKKAKQVQEIKITKKLTYAEASQIWKTQQTQKQATKDTMEISQPKPNSKVQIDIQNPDQNQVKITSNDRPQVSTSSKVAPIMLTANFPNHIAQPQSEISNQATTSFPHASITSEIEASRKPMPNANFITTAKDEQIVEFICNLILSFTEGKTEEEINALILTAAKRSLQQKRKHLAQNDGN